jgi:predicted tellurium resistance membrane protein TerC
MEQLHTAGFWWALARIAGVTAVLCADSAVALALVARAAPAARRARAWWLGMAAALLLRGVACVGAMALWAWPGVPALAGLLLLWFALRLLMPERAGRKDAARPSGGRRLAAAAVLAEGLTALCHGVAIAQAAGALEPGGRMLLAAPALALAAVLLALAATGLPRLLRRVQGLLPLGAALVAWGGAAALAGDPLTRALLPAWWGEGARLAPALGAVLALGWALARRAAPAPRAIVDLAPADRQ